MRRIGRRILLAGFYLLAMLAGGCGGGGGGGGAASVGDPAAASTAETVTSAEPAAPVVPAGGAPAAPVARSGPLLFLSAAAEGQAAVLLFSLPDLSPGALAHPVGFAPDAAGGMTYDRGRDILYVSALAQSGPSIRVFTQASAMTDNAVATRSILLASDVEAYGMKVDPVSDVLYISTTRSNSVALHWVVVDHASTASGPSAVRDFQPGLGADYFPAFDAARSLAYVRGRSSDVDVYSAVAAASGSAQPVGRIAGLGCIPLAVDDARDRLYCGRDSLILVIDGASTPEAHVVKQLWLPQFRGGLTLDAANDRLYMTDRLDMHAMYVQDRLSELPDGATLTGTTFALPADVYVSGIAAR